MENIIRIYKPEEIEEMNCYFNKGNDNKIFTLLELQLWNKKILGGAN